MQILNDDAGTLSRKLLLRRAQLFFIAPGQKHARATPRQLDGDRPANAGGGTGQHDPAARKVDERCDAHALRSPLEAPLASALWANGSETST